MLTNTKEKEVSYFKAYVLRPITKYYMVNDVALSGRDITRVFYINNLLQIEVAVIVILFVVGLVGAMKINSMVNPKVIMIALMAFVGVPVMFGRHHITQNFQNLAMKRLQDCGRSGSQIHYQTIPLVGNFVLLNILRKTSANKEEINQPVKFSPIVDGLLFGVGPVIILLEIIAIIVIMMVSK